jgi:hypothetical protein
MLTLTAIECREATLPQADPHALLVAALGVGQDVLGLAGRIVEAGHDHDPADCPYCAGATHKHPPADPKPDPPRPPAPPRPPKDRLAGVDANLLAMALSMDAVNASVALLDAGVFRAKLEASMRVVRWLLDDLEDQVTLRAAE